MPERCTAKFRGALPLHGILFFSAVKTVLKSLLVPVHTRKIRLQTKREEYRKMSIISPGLGLYLFKRLFTGLFSGKLIFGGAYYWREFCVSK